MKMASLDEKIYSSDSLENDLINSSLVIGVNSNVIVQACAMDIICLSVDFSNKSKSLNFADFGICVQCKRPQDLLADIQSHLFDESFISYRKKVVRENLAKYFLTSFDGKSSERIISYVSMRRKNNIENIL